MATVKAGPFDISRDKARKWLGLPNPNGKSNRNVLRPWANGMDITRRPSDTWIIDFGVGMPLNEAALCEVPFEHVEKYVRTQRDSSERETKYKNWWLMARPIPKMRAKLKGLARYIATPVLAKHRLFVWMDVSVLADHQLVVVARDDDTIFGVLHSRAHELWSLRMGTSLEDRPRYTPTTTFETFPFPEGMIPDLASNEYSNSQAAEIAGAAVELVTLRESWLNPLEWVDRVPEVVGGYPDRIIPKLGHEADLKKRTLTNL